MDLFGTRYNYKLAKKLHSPSFILALPSNMISQRYFAIKCRVAVLAKVREMPLEVFSLHVASDLIFAAAPKVWADIAEVDSARGIFSYVHI